MWEYSSRQASEVLEALERQTGYGDDTADFRGTGRRAPPNEAIQKKVFDMLPLLVSSAAAVDKPSGGTGGDTAVYGNQGVGGEADLPGVAARRVDDAAAVAGVLPVADAALSFLSREIASLSAVTPGANRGAHGRRKMALAKALLGVLETCYNGSAGGGASDDDSDLLGPESWPWNAAAASAAAAANSAWCHPSWPVRSLPSWGPRLADIAGDRSSRDSGEGAGSGSTAVDVVDRAARVVQLVLRGHAGAAWRVALSALRLPPSASASGSGSAPHTSGRMEDEECVVPLCGPLLERICLELPLMDLPVRVHAAVFEAHGWLSLLPCGMMERDYFTKTVV